jgi:hypothetical protein
MKLRRFTFVFGLIALAACSSDGRRQLAALDQLEKRRNEQATALDTVSKEPLNLRALVERAKAFSPIVTEAMIKGLSGEAEADQLLAAGLPRLTLTASYGQSVFVRRDEPDSRLRLSPYFTWEVIQLLQVNRIALARARATESSGLLKKMAQKQALLVVMQSYADMHLAISTKSSIETQTHIVERRLAISERLRPYQRASDSKSDDLRLAIEQLSQARVQNDLSYQQARINLLNHCAINTAQTMAAYQPADRVEPLPSLGDFLRASLENNETLSLAQIKSQNMKDKKALVKASRWTRFAVLTDFNNILNAISASPFSSVSWTIALLDQGDHNRQLLRARADLLIAQLEAQQSTNDVTTIAGKIWLEALDSAALVRQAQSKLSKLELKLMLAEKNKSMEFGGADQYREALLELEKAKLESVQAKWRHQLALWQASVITDKDIQA